MTTSKRARTGSTPSPQWPGLSASDRGCESVYLCGKNIVVRLEDHGGSLQRGKPPPRLAQDRPSQHLTLAAQSWPQHETQNSSKCSEVAHEASATSTDAISRPWLPQAAGLPGPPRLPESLEINRDLGSTLSGFEKWDFGPRRRLARWQSGHRWESGALAEPVGASSLSGIVQG